MMSGTSDRLFFLNEVSDDSFSGFSGKIG